MGYLQLDPKMRIIPSSQGKYPELKLCEQFIIGRLLIIPFQYPEALTRILRSKDILKVYIPAIITELVIRVIRINATGLEEAGAVRGFLLEQNLAAQNLILQNTPFAFAAHFDGADRLDHLLFLLIVDTLFVVGLLLFGDRLAARILLIFFESQYGSLFLLIILWFIFGDG